MAIPHILCQIILRKSKSCASASDDNLVPKHGATSTASNIFAKDTRKLKEANAFHHLRQKHSRYALRGYKEILAAGDVPPKWKTIYSTAGAITS